MSTAASQPTARQASILRFVLIRILLGKGPAVREMCEEFDIASPNGVACNINPLVEKGRLLKQENQSRGLSIPGQDCYFPLGRISQAQTITGGEAHQETSDLTEQVLAAALPLVDGSQPSSACVVLDSSLIQYRIRPRTLLILTHPEAIGEDDDVLYYTEEGKLALGTFIAGMLNVVGVIRCIVRL